MNVVTTGRLDYLFGPRRMAVPAGAISVFWAALPHQVVATERGSTARWLTVPLDQVLRWRLAGDLIGQLLSGAPLVGFPLTAIGARGQVEGDGWPDHGGAERQFLRWDSDLAGRDSELQRIVLLEMEAFLRRILRVAQPTVEPVADIPAGARTTSRAAAMAAFIAARFREPLAVDDVASVVHLNPRYAMQVFRDGVGTTIGAYLTQCRLAEAQRLLITSQIAVSSVASLAGFGSPSRLYVACQGAGLPSPAAYRRMQQSAAGWPEASLDEPPQSR